MYYVTTLVYIKVDLGFPHENKRVLLFDCFYCEGHERKSLFIIRLPRLS